MAIIRSSSQKSEERDNGASAPGSHTSPREAGREDLHLQGVIGDLFVVAAKANPANPRDIGLVLVEERMDGFRRGRLLKKLGFHTQDTAEIFFENVCLEPIHVIGDPAKGLNYMSAAWPRSG